MVWQRKPTAPDTINLGEAFAALITGDATWSWLLGWIPMIGNPLVDVNLLCQKGPSSTGELAPEDFLTGNRNPLAQVIDTVMLALKLRNAAYDRVFGAYCEFVTEAGSGCVLQWEGISVQTHSRAFEEYDEVARFDLPSWATTVRITETLLPGNAQNAAWPANWKSLRVRILDSDNNAVVQDSHPVNLPQFASYVTINVPTNHRQIVVDVNDNPPGDYGFRIEACGVIPESSEDYVPTPQPQPDGVLAPATKTYTTIADLGRELDNLEFKVDFVQDMLRFTGGLLPIPGGAADEPVDIVPEEEIDLADAVGVVITLSGVPAAADVGFGVPQRLARVGWVTLGTAAAWYPAIEITHTPFVIAPLPLNCVRMQATLWPPTTATLTKLLPPK